MIQKPKLPYVFFTSTVKQVKDADGHIVDLPEYTAHVISGPKSEFEQEANAWLASLLEKGTTRGPFDEAANEYRAVWYPTFKKMFDDFKAGEEMTHPGTPLRTCMAFMKTEVAQCERVHIFSLEDLASANEEQMQHIGMGGRALKDKAAQVLASKGANTLVEENSALKVQLEQMQGQINELIAAGLKAAPGRPRKEPEHSG